MSKTNTSLRTALFLGAATAAALSLSTVAFAQNVETVVVTGTLIQGNANLVSPITVIDQTTLDQRGISSIQDALQMTLANNGPAVTNNWTSNGNFAQGASGISLRALTTNSTLVMFDGMRAAYYPLADDGIRNFVDLNTIPDDIVENIQILRDGASSSYGADAIAGVVNIITKKEFQGVSARAEAGISDSGIAASERFSITAGVGDLGKDRVNFYISASYFHSDIVHARDLPYPFNTSDWSNICDTACGSTSAYGYLNHTRNADGSLAINTNTEFMVRPGTHNADGSFTVTPGSSYQNLSTGCGTGTSYTLTAADRSGAGAIDPATVCQYDVQKLYGVTNPAVTRFGLSGHTAFQLPNNMEGYVEANFMQDSVSYPSYPATIYGAAPAGVYYPQFRTSGVGGSFSPNYAAGSEVLYLPNWVCSERVNCNTAADKHLNPNNPFASATTPTDARIIGRDMTATEFNETRDRTYRVAAGLNGSFFDDWKYDIGMTAMHIDLHQIQAGYVNIQHLLDVIADGTYNFINPSANSEALNTYLKPTDVTNMSSDLDQVRASVTAPLFKLPGGDLTVVVGGSIYYEAVDDPSANSDINGPTARYFTLNAFGTKGSRDVYSTFFEVNAPVLEELVINASGRYDYYSSGQSNFSPKIGVWSKPIDWLTLKGTYSQGFRIPSFAESNALPTTGYVTNTSGLFTDAYLHQYGANCSVATFSSCPTYIKSASYGLTTIANSHLQPEKSRSWVADVTVQPIDELTITTTYYNIKKTGAIANLNCSQALKHYYGAAAAGDPLCAVIADAADVNTPGATPRVAFLDAPLVNANAVRTSGFDFSVTWDSDIDAVEDALGVKDDLGTVHLTSSAQATFIQNLDTKFADGTIERYDGTLGNNNLTAGTGTPKWRGSWQSTFTAGKYEFTSTLNWNSGYNLSAMDQGTGYRDCGLSDGSVPCRTADYFTWDINVQAHVRDDTTIYLTVNNVLGDLPPVDTIATYGITGYNVVVGGDGILGRYLKAGIKLDF